MTITLENRPRYVVRYGWRCRSYAHRKSAISRLAWWIIWDAYGYESSRTRPVDCTCKASAVDQLDCPFHAPYGGGYLSRLHSRLERWITYSMDNAPGHAGGPID